MVREKCVKRLFWRMCEKITGGWSKLHNFKICSSPHILLDQQYQEGYDEIGWRCWKDKLIQYFIIGNQKARET